MTKRLEDKAEFFLKSLPDSCTWTLFLLIMVFPVIVNIYRLHFEETPRNQEVTLTLAVFALSLNVDICYE